MTDQQENFSWREVTTLTITAIVLLVFTMGLKTRFASAACSPATNYGSVSVKVDIPQDGTYRVWSRLETTNSANNSYYLEVDGDKCYTVGGATIAANNWVSLDYQNGKTDSKLDIHLTAGSHTLKAIGKQAPVKLDNLTLSTNTNATATPSTTTASSTSNRETVVKTHDSFVWLYFAFIAIACLSAGVYFLYRRDKLNGLLLRLHLQKLIRKPSIVTADAGVTVFSDPAAEPVKRGIKAAVGGWFAHIFRLGPLIFILVFAVFGSALLLASHAEPQTTVIVEMENGTINVPATKGSDNNASNKAYIQFNAPPASGKTPTKVVQKSSSKNSSSASVKFNKDRPFATNSPWNTLTPAGTKWYDTAVLHQTTTNGTPNGGFRHWWVGTNWQIWYSKPTDPVWTFQMPNFIAAQWHRNRPAKTFTMRGPSNLAAGTDSDHALALVDPVSGDYVEVWQAVVNSTTHVVTSDPGPGWAQGNVITGTGVGDLAGNNAGTRAANYSIQAGEITPDEISGSTPIDHALVVVLPFDMLKGGWPSPGVNYVPPATADDSGGWAGPIKMGSRIGIPAGVVRPAGLSPLGVKVFNALQKYGSFAGDFAGGQWPMFQADLPTNDNSSACSLFCYWNYGGSSDMEKIGPLLRVADYQP